MQVRSVDDPVNKNSKIREEKKYYYSLKTDEETNTFAGKEVKIIEELFAVLEIDKAMLPTLRDAPKKKLSEETAKADKV